MESVPMPQVLDPDRIRRDDREDLTTDEHRSRASAFHAELVRTTEYGQALWNELTAVREYLAGNTPGAAAEDDAWAAWSTRYGSVTSSLAGATGDGGFGAQEAKVIAAERRSNT